MRYVSRRYCTVRATTPPKPTRLATLMAGSADPIQQKRAIDWILKSACGIPEWPYVPGDVEATHVHLGRHFVGHQIMKLSQMNLSAVKDREPNADQHEPK